MQPPTCTPDRGWRDLPMPAGTACVVDGESGTCNGAGGGALPPPQLGHVPASYVVLSVLYAPPGSAASGAQKSTADYGSSSTTGVSTSASASFKSDVGVSASVTLGNPLVASGSVTASYNASQQTGDSSEIDLSKSTSNDIKVTGPATDGIDHNLDTIYLWLNPMIDFSVTNSGKSTAWGLSNNGPNMTTQYVYVGWLKNPATMPAGVQAQLANANIAPSDYATILARDPFATGNASIDPTRFLITHTTFPYEPQYGPGDASPAQTYIASNDLTQKASISATDSYNVGLSVQLGFNIPLIVKASVTESASWTWTNSSTQGSSQESKQSSAVTVTGPSAAYAGPTNIDVYYDTIYSSFFFAFTPNSVAAARSASASVKGAVTGGVANEPVLLTVNGQTYRTYTNRSGQYFFYNTPPGAGTIMVRGVAHPVTLSPGNLLPILAL